MAALFARPPTALELLEGWRLQNPSLHSIERSLDSLLLALGAHQPVPRGESTGSPLERWTIYDDAATPYLTRSYLSHQNREEWPGVFLHYFHRSDSDRELHNHPWKSAVAVVLTGGYLEHRIENHNGKVTTAYRPPLSVNFLFETTYHRVELATDHAWTLFIAGERRAPETEEHAGWGFVDLVTRKYEDAKKRAERLGQPW